MSDTTTVQEVIESAPAGTEVFYSIHRGLQLCRQHTVATENPATGHKIVHVEPVVYKFEPLGTLVVKHGQDMLPDGPNGEMQDAVAWLTSHPRLNRRFQWEGHEAGRPLPHDDDYLASVTQATAHGDVQTLLRLRREEEDTHARPLLLSAVSNALKALESTPQPEPEDDPLPESYDRAEALEWLASKDVVIAADASDEQVYKIVLQTVENDGELAP